MHFEGTESKEFGGTKKGRIYLTSHRMIFINKHDGDPMKSFSFPFFSMSSIELEQPIFGANYIKGKVSAQPGGNWTGHAIFKLKFLTGGAIEYGQAMLQAAKMASRYMPPAPPPYTAPSGPFYPAAPPAYMPPPGGYYGFVPPTHVFPNYPPENTVFMTDMPPPYPGISPPPYGTPNPPPPQGPGGYQPSGVAPPPPAGFHVTQNGVPPNVGYNQTPNYNAASAPPSENPAFSSEKSQGAQAAYYFPQAPNYAYVPQSNYYGQPPSGPPPPYSESSKKQQ